MGPRKRYQVSTSALSSLERQVTPTGAISPSPAVGLHTTTFDVGEDSGTQVLNLDRERTNQANLAERSMYGSATTQDESYSSGGNFTDHRDTQHYATHKLNHNARRSSLLSQSSLTEREGLSDIPDKSYRDFGDDVGSKWSRGSVYGHRVNEKGGVEHYSEADSGKLENGYLASSSAISQNLHPFNWESDDIKSIARRRRRGSQDLDTSRAAANHSSGNSIRDARSLMGFTDPPKALSCDSADNQGASSNRNKSIVDDKSDRIPMESVKYIKYNDSIISKTSPTGGSYKTLNDFEHFRSTSPSSGEHRVKRNAFYWKFLSRKRKTLTIIVFLVLMGLLAVIQILFILQSGSETGTEASKSILGQYNKYAVSTDAAPCAKIGSALLAKGGSAVDAAIGTLICMGLVLPNSLGIGGGCLMTIYEAKTGKAISINGRETAPKSSTERMFDGKPKNSSRGSLSVGVPGELAAYSKAHKRFGKLAWSELFVDSIKMAKEGIPVVEHLANAIRDPRHAIYMEEPLKKLFTNADRKLVDIGEKFYMNKLVETLELIQNDESVEIFYRGELGQKFINDLTKAGGIMTMDDLRDYYPIEKEALRVDLADDLTMFTQPVPGSGIIASIILRIMKKFDYYQAKASDLDFDLFYHRLVEAFKYGYAQRAGLEDKPDSPERMKKLMEKLESQAFIDYAFEHIDDLAHNDTRYLDNEVFYKEDAGTAHVSVVDADGNAAAVTTSVNLYFGSGLISESTGIIYNDIMDDFVSPNITNKFGVRPSEYNHIKPGRRPISSMAPSVFIDKNGKVRLVIGASGGTMITTGVAFVSLRNLYLGEDIKTSIDAFRLHHQFLPNVVNYEDGFDNEYLKSLKDRGHEIKRISGRSSVVMAVANEPQHDGQNKITANSDFRKGGSVDGF